MIHQPRTAQIGGTCHAKQSGAAGIRVLKLRDKLRIKAAIDADFDIQFKATKVSIGSGDETAVSSPLPMLTLVALNWISKSASIAAFMRNLSRNFRTLIPAAPLCLA